MHHIGAASTVFQAVLSLTGKEFVYLYLSVVNV